MLFRTANLSQLGDFDEIIDVRTPAEFDALRVAGAVNIPLDRLDAAALRQRFGANAALYCICQTGTRSQLAARMLREAGFSHVVHVDGGTNAWMAAGLPVERGSAPAARLQ